jgi:putative ABC transport system substrate-binding protein
LWDANRPDGLAETRAAARMLGTEIVSLDVRGPDDFEGAFERATRAEIDGLFQLEQPVIIPNRPRVVQFAIESGVPGMYTSRAFVQEGGLLAYGANILAKYRRAAYYVDRILKGTKPADLPVEQPREFEFVINLKTAQALGLTIPQHVLLQATEII